MKFKIFPLLITLFLTGCVSWESHYKTTSPSIDLELCRQKGIEKFPMLMNSKIVTIDKELPGACPGTGKKNTCVQPTISSQMYDQNQAARDYYITTCMAENGWKKKGYIEPLF